VVKYFKFDLIHPEPDASGSSTFKNRKLQNLTMNEIAQKDFKIHRAAKTCKNTMNEN
jgi:hypothetical protein